MRAVILLACLAAGCATRAPELAPGEYAIPLFLANDTMDQVIVEHAPGDTEQALFCIEMEADTLCVSMDGERVIRTRYPRLNVDAFLDESEPGA